MKIKCSIIEDEEPAAELLSFFIKQHSTLQLEHIFHNNIDLPAELLSGEHLLFLDIEMPFRNGIDFLKQQQNTTKIPVILTTSHSQFGIEAFNLSVIDYLVKPFSKNRFNEAIEKAHHYFIALQATKKEKFIWITDDYKKIKIPVSSILFIESLKQYVKIYTTEKRYMIIKTLKSIEEELSTNNFIRCHKSFLINKTQVQSYNRSHIKINNTEIPIGKQFLDETLKALQNNTFQ